MYHNLFDDSDDLDRFLGVTRGIDTTHINPDHSSYNQLNDLLKKLIRKMGRFFPIDKATVTFYDAREEMLRVTQVYENGSIKKGLRLNFPVGNSLMYQVLMHGYPVVDNFPDKLSSNIIERKILLNDMTQSVLVAPLIYNNIKMGLLSLTSQKEYAFGLYLEGVCEGMVEDFGRQLGKVFERSPGVLQPSG